MTRHAAKTDLLSRHKANFVPIIAPPKENDDVLTNSMDCAAKNFRNRAKDFGSALTFYLASNMI
jgi:hypothetical protein